MKKYGAKVKTEPPNADIDYLSFTYNYFKNPRQ